MNQKGFIPLDKTIKLGVLLAILVASFSVFYYFVIFLPQKEGTKLELQKEASIREALIEQQKLDLQQEEQENAKREVATQRALLDYCLDAAEQYTTDAFEKVCPGAKTAKAGESLSCKPDVDIAQLIDVLKEEEEKEKAECYRKYPQK